MNSFDAVIVVARQVMLIAGGWVAAKGYANQSELDAVIGGALVLVAVLHRWWQIRKGAVK